MVTAFSSKKLAIAQGSTVLVTGVTGLIGSHVANQLLLAGFKVRGTTRSASKGQWITSLFDAQYGTDKFSLAEVSDMTKPEAYTDAIKGVTGIAHVASDLSFGPDPNTVVTGTIQIVTALLTAASKQSSVKRFVYTSSSTAITAPKPNKKFTISTDQWNEEDVAAAWKPPPYEQARAWAVYGASKTQAEQAAWKFVREEKPGFVLNTVLPNTNFGKILSPGNQAGSTAGWIKDIFESGKIQGFLVSVPPQWFVDVEDTARLHVAALVDLDVKDERILGFAAPYNFEAILKALRKAYPERKFEFEDEGKEAEDLSVPENEPGAELLRKWFGKEGWTSFEESLRRNTEGLLG